MNENESNKPQNKIKSSDSFDEEKTNFDRRKFCKTGAKGLALGTAINSFDQFAYSQENEEDHFFIFVELMGGVHWITATDGRDIDKMPLNNSQIIQSMKITDTLPTIEEYEQLVRNEFYKKEQEHGKFILLPYKESLQDSHIKGVTNLGQEYILGFAGHDLQPFVNDIAVCRGVHMQGDFHGIRNASGEMFAGTNTGSNSHVAAFLTTMLEKKYGAKLLDNLVFENATYATSDNELARDEIRLDGESLAAMIGNSANFAGQAGAEARFVHGRNLAQALVGTKTVSALHKEVFSSYISATKRAPIIQKMLIELKEQFSAVDASLDLNVQIDTALTMLNSGLSRVITLCMGAPNGKNKVDGFGLFDCHEGLYHLGNQSPDKANTQRHHLNVERSMKSLGYLISKLKATKYQNTNKTLWDMTTVVMTSDFARPSNFSGNEAGGFDEGSTSFGNGHYPWNNNYIFTGGGGRGVRGGMWVGKNEPIRQMGEMAVAETLENPDPAQIQFTPVTYNFSPIDGGTDENGGGAYQPNNLDYESDNRPIMARDMVKTTMAIADLDQEFDKAYPEKERFEGTKTIRSIVG